MFGTSIVRIQLMASLGAAALDHILPARGGHPSPKTVLFHGSAVVGLVCTLRHANSYFAFTKQTEPSKAVPKAVDSKSMPKVGQGKSRLKIALCTG
jgi:hypothetical protein